jgi:hypothetical protein
MISYRRHLLSFAVLLIVCSGCGQTYSPYLMLPKEPLRTDEVQIAGSAGWLPTVSKLSPSVAGGEIGVLRYGVTDKLSFQGEAWTNFVPSIRPIGFSLEAVRLLSDRTADWRWAFIPRVAVMNDGITLSGWGASATLAAWTPEVLGTRPYMGGGLLIGAGDNGNSSYLLGFGGQLNAGFNYEIIDHIGLNAEVSFPMVIVREDAHTYHINAFGVWGIGAGYRF